MAPSARAPVWFWLGRVPSSDTGPAKGAPPQVPVPQLPGFRAAVSYAGRQGQPAAGQGGADTPAVGAVGAEAEASGLPRTLESEFSDARCVCFSSWFILLFYSTLIYKFGRTEELWT